MSMVSRMQKLDVGFIMQYYLNHNRKLGLVARFIRKREKIEKLTSFVYPLLLHKFLSCAIVGGWK